MDQLLLLLEETGIMTNENTNNQNTDQNGDRNNDQNTVQDIDLFTFSEDAQNNMADSFNDILDSKLGVALPKALNSMYTGLLKSFQSNISKSIHGSLQRMNMKLCTFVNSINGDRCTNPTVRDRATGELSIGCREHKYLLEKKKLGLRSLKISSRSKISLLEKTKNKLVKEEIEQPNLVNVDPAPRNHLQ